MEPALDSHPAHPLTRRTLHQDSAEEEWIFRRTAKVLLPLTALACADASSPSSQHCARARCGPPRRNVRAPGPRTRAARGLVVVLGARTAVPRSPRRRRPPRPRAAATVHVRLAFAPDTRSSAVAGEPMTVVASGREMSWRATRGGGLTVSVRRAQGCVIYVGRTPAAVTRRKARRRRRRRRPRSSCRSPPLRGPAASGPAGDDRQHCATPDRLIHHRIGGSPRSLDYARPSVAGTFADRLREGPPVVADGGIGVLVLAAAVPGLRCPEEANLRAPDAVVSVHVSFINAGAELIETNTFGANRRKLAQHFLEDEFERINSAAVKLAREAREITGREVFIGGSIGPVGEHDGGRRSPSRRGSSRAAAPTSFMLETFYDLVELELAIEAVRSVSRLPIVALMSFDSDAVTIGGVRARDAGERLRAARRRRVRRKPRPRPGRGARRARRDGGRRRGRSPRCRTSASRRSRGARLAFPHATPEYFADFAARARALGAQLIGGCCGTTPAQIAAIRAAVDENRRVRDAAPRAREQRRRACCRRGAADRARAAARGGRVRRLGAARPAARRERRRAARRGARGSASRGSRSSST